MTSIAVRVSLKCPHCLGQVIVGGVTGHVLCHHCQKTIPLEGPRRWYTNPIVVRRVLEVGKTRTAGLGGQAEVAMEKAPVICPRCQAPFDAAAIVAAQAPSIACSACHASMAVRPIPPEFMPDMKLSGVLVGEQLQGTGHDDTASPEHPIVMACMSCGASLHVDGNDRMLDCSFCHATNYLPDPVWARLHPAREIVTFYLVSELG